MSFIYRLKSEFINTISDYEPWKYPEHFQEAFEFIKKRLHTPIAKKIEDALAKGEFSSATKLLLEYYYDHYMNILEIRIPNSGNVDITANNVDDAFQKLLQTIDGIKVPY